MKWARGICIWFHWNRFPLMIQALLIFFLSWRDKNCILHVYIDAILCERNQLLSKPGSAELIET